jgi:hypothetical protein
MSERTNNAPIAERPRPRRAALILAVLAGVLATAAVAPSGADAAALFTKLPGEMTTRRYMPAAAMLPNGEVLVAAGRNTSSETVPVTGAELFNPATGSFEAIAAKMPQERSEPAFAALPDGNVLLVGGDVNSLKSKKELDTGELFNPAAASFEPIASHPIVARVGAAATLLGTGEVLIAGGYHEGEYLTSAELYDPATRVFSAVPGSMAVGRYAPSVAALPGGRALVLGGYLKTISQVASAEIFNAATGTFETLGAGHELVEPRSEAAAVTLADGNVLVIGGYNEKKQNLRTVERFVTATSTFELLPTELQEERDGPAAVLLPDGRVLVVGGYAEAKTEPERWLSSAEIRGVEPPSAATGYASSVAATSATLGGSVASETASGSFFQYGTSNAYGLATAKGTVGASTSAVPFSTVAAGLAPGTTYHFRAVSEQLGGVSYGADRTFTTATVPPTLSGVSQSNRRWRVGGTPASISRKRRPPLGTTFSFALDQPATVTLKFTQSVGGRTVKGRCVAQTRRNRHRRSCKRTVTRGTLSLAGHAGADKVTFQGTISAGRRLGPGNYTVLISARNAAGQTSAAQRLSFVVVR